jgi:hypothetical protein
VQKYNFCDVRETIRSKCATFILQKYMSYQNHAKRPLVEGSMDISSSLEQILLPNHYRIKDVSTFYLIELLWKYAHSKMVDGHAKNKTPGRPKDVH